MLCKGCFKASQALSVLCEKVQVCIYRRHLTSKVLPAPPPSFPCNLQQKSTWLLWCFTVLASTPPTLFLLFLSKQSQSAFDIILSFASGLLQSTRFFSFQKCSLRGALASFYPHVDLAHSCNSFGTLRAQYQKINGPFFLSVPGDLTLCGDIYVFAQWFKRRPICKCPRFGIS